MVWHLVPRDLQVAHYTIDGRPLQVGHLFGQDDAPSANPNEDSPMPHRNMPGAAA